jgi:hypothetical protein
MMVCSRCGFQYSAAMFDRKCIQPLMKPGGPVHCNGQIVEAKTASESSATPEGRKDQ